MCLGFVRNYPSYMVVRAFLGIAEGGLLPGIVSVSGSSTRTSHLANRGIYRYYIYRACTHDLKWP